MRNALSVSLIFILLSSLAVSAVDIGSISLGFHLIPSVEQEGDRRVVDLSLSLGMTLQLDAENSIDIMALVDSSVTSLGTSTQLNHRVTELLTAGIGFTVLWPFSEDEKLQWPILGTFAHAAARTYFYPELWTEAAVSFSLLTLAYQLDGWKLVPLSELPTLSLAADLQLSDEASLQPRLTFQPVITDTTVLESPVGRISDDLLILYMASIFLRALW